LLYLALVLHLSSYVLRATPPPDIYALSLHDALPILAVVVAADEHVGHVETSDRMQQVVLELGAPGDDVPGVDHQVDRELRERPRSEEHTSELQSRFDLVCRLLLEKKKKEQQTEHRHD